MDPNTALLCVVTVAASKFHHERQTSCDPVRLPQSLLI